MKAGKAAREAIHLLAGVAVALLALSSGTVQGQVPQNVTAKGFSAPYREGTQLKAFFSGDEAKPITGGKGELLVKNFEMKWFGKTTNDVELIGRAPECFFNINDKTAWGTNRIEVFSGTTNFFIEGIGFRCRQTKSNAVLTISNQVHTILLRDKSKTNSAAEPPLEIVSEHFQFVSETHEDKAETRIATYTDAVRVEDPDILMTSGLLTVDLPSGTNRVRNIVAERDVTIVSKRDKTQATGDRATYLRQEEEIITLHGSPGWKDAQSEGKADVLVFNKTRKTVRAESKAAVKFPRGTFADAGLFGGGQTNVVAGTNQFVEVMSELLVIGLPTTNRTARSLVASTNVVILSPADQSRATADNAEFFEEQGLLRLNGAAEWKTDKMHARGDSIWLNRSNRVFGARSRGPMPAYLRLLDNTAGKAKPGTNEFIEITCNNYEVNTNVALFQSGSGEDLGISLVKKKFFE